MALLDLGEAAAIDRLIADLRLGITGDLRELDRALISADTHLITSSSLDNMVQF